MADYVNVRASEILDQGELVCFLKSRFQQRTKTVGHHVIEGTECVEVRVRTDSSEFKEIQQFIHARRARGDKAYSALPIGWYIRKYGRQELLQSEILQLVLNSSSYFETCGQECGTKYETLCSHCNWGFQLSELTLDLRRIPQHKDICGTIALAEFVVSENFVRLFVRNSLKGAEFKPILSFRKPSYKSDRWYQLIVTGKIGKLAEETKIGNDPFDSTIAWRCPNGHSFGAQLLSEISLYNESWDNSDISAPTDRFGAGQNLVRPKPLIVISQRLFRLMYEAGLKGFSCESAHLIQKRQGFAQPQ